MKAAVLDEMLLQPLLPQPLLLESSAGLEELLPLTEFRLRLPNHRPPATATHPSPQNQLLHLKG